MIKACQNSSRPIPVNVAFDARDIVRKRWREQGIWNKKWNQDDDGPMRWAHEEPLEDESEVETDPEVEPSPGFSLPKPPKPTKSDDEKR